MIISNNINSIDVDKLDYLIRDIFMIYGKKDTQYSRLLDDIIILENKIVYPEQAAYDIFTLFRTRHDLHRQVYCHKGVIAIQYLIISLMETIDDILHLSSSIDMIDKFCNLTDEYILESVKFINNIKATEIVDMINKREMYQFIDCIISREKNVKLNDFLVSLNDKKIIVFETKLGFVSGDKLNPLDSIYVYNTKNTNNIISIKKNKNNITALIPEVYQEYIQMIFYNEKKTYNNVNINKYMFYIKENIKNLT
jgi:HD superfamily phosphohydrolase